MLQVQEQKLMGGERFHVKRGEISFSVPSVELDMAPGESREGSFTLYGADGRAASGFVLSSQPPMKVLTGMFSGAKEMIAYLFDADGFVPGDQVEGEFRVLSDQGEYLLPFCVKIRKGALDSSLGPVRNLIHFVNLARTAFREAVRIFYQKEFAEVIEGEEDEDLLTLYRGLSARPGNEHNVEEFLISAGKKQPVEFQAEPGQIRLELSAGDSRPITGQIRIRRSGWGYTRLSVELRGEFLSGGMERLEEPNFPDGICMLPVTVDPMRMHAGFNYGRVILRPSCGEPIEIPVTVSYCRNTALQMVRRRENHETILQMMQTFIAFRIRKMDAASMAEKMSSLIRRLQESDRNNPLTALYRIHYLLTVHQEQDALWELQALNRRLFGLDGPMPEFSTAQFDLEDDVNYAYRMYLTILCAESCGAAEGIVHDAVRAIEEGHRRNPDSFWITWLLMYADADLGKRPSRVLDLLREQYDRGCRSPILYMEVWQMVRLTPTVLYELGEFELQVLLFAARQGILTDAVMTRVNDLARRRKTFSKRLFRVLTMAYDTQLPADLKQRDTLESICSLLIRGNVTQAWAFPWYQRGVEQGLGITRLLDYYMLSLPPEYDGELPQIILLYYSYQNTLPAPQTAYLYRYLTEHRDQYGDLYAQYAGRIESFTYDQLTQRRISQDLAVLYMQYLSSGRPLSQETAAAASALAHTCRIRTDRPGSHRAVLVYHHLTTEQYCPLQSGTAWVSVYGTANRFFLEEDDGNRHAASVPLQCDPMMDADAVDALLGSYEVDHYLADLALSEEILRRTSPGAADLPEGMTRENAPRLLRLVQSPQVTPSHRRRLCLLLLAFYEREGDAEGMSFLLGQILPEGLGAADRAEMIRRMTVQGLLPQAFSWICRFGTGGIAGDVLLRLASGLLRSGAPVDQEVLAQIAWQSFAADRYDGEVLSCLSTDWDGTTAQLERVREAVLNYGMDAYGISRRMLTQMLFTGETEDAFPEMLSCCRRNAAGTEFLTDVLAQGSHHYYINGRFLPEEAFRMIGGYGMDGIPLLDICRIAWLRWASERSGEVPARDMEITELFLSDLVGRGVVFPFFRQFAGVLPALQAYADETLVEYRAGSPDPKAKVMFHYAVERGGIREQYKAREMKEMYEGVYVTGFLLFFGEQLHYYVTDDVQEKNIVESGTLGQDARIAASGHDRFGTINEIAMLTALGRDEEAIVLMEEYERKSYLVKRLFPEE